MPSHDLPIRFATRVLLDSVLYSNAMPPWELAYEHDYRACEGLVATRIDRYLAGEAATAFPTIEVPTRRNASRVWVAPSLCDQIVLQACVSEVAQAAALRLHQSAVFSYRPPIDPSAIQLTESQVGAWRQFQQSTEAWLAIKPCMLQVDIANAFGNVDRERFFQFVSTLTHQEAVVPLLRSLVDASGPPHVGLPIVNDSMFYLGNAYFAELDQVLLGENVTFIRFVDDYRIFAASYAELEKTHERISKAFAERGFPLNERKTRLGSAEEYLHAISKARYAETDDSGDYVSAVVFAEICEPTTLATLVRKVIRRPSQYMTEGFGRLLMGAVRRLSLNDDAATTMNYPHSPWGTFADEVGKRHFQTQAINLLEEYVRGQETWRSVWILNLFTMVGVNEALRARLDEVLGSVFARGAGGEWTRLWAQAVRSQPRKLGANEIYELDYLEVGRRLYEE